MRKVFETIFEVILHNDLMAVFTHYSIMTLYTQFRLYGVRIYWFFWSFFGRVVQVLFLKNSVQVHSSWDTWNCSSVQVPPSLCMSWVTVPFSSTRPGRARPWLSVRATGLKWFAPRWRVETRETTSSALCKKALRAAPSPESWWTGTLNTEL